MPVLIGSSAMARRPMDRRTERPTLQPNDGTPRGIRRPGYERRNMFDIKRKTIEWAGRPLTLETGRIARQADGAVLATYGETVVLATVVYGRAPKPGLDFFPLTVNYQEKTFAAGKIPGGYFKREGRPTEKETLVSRLIDRPIRPLFVKGFKNETQVVVTVLQHDMENDPDVLGMVAASAAPTLAPAQGGQGGKIVHSRKPARVHQDIERWAGAGSGPVAWLRNRRCHHARGRSGRRLCPVDRRGVITTAT